jgi:hypothetical protein
MLLFFSLNFFNFFFFFVYIFALFFPFLTLCYGAVFNDNSFLCLMILNSKMVRIVAFQAIGRGSIPR